MDPPNTNWHRALYQDKALERLDGVLGNRGVDVADFAEDVFGDRDEDLESPEAVALQTGVSAVIAYRDEFEPIIEDEFESTKEMEFARGYIGACAMEIIANQESKSST